MKAGKIHNFHAFILEFKESAYKHLIKSVILRYYYFNINVRLYFCCRNYKLAYNII